MPEPVRRRRSSSSKAFAAPSGAGGSRKVDLRTRVVLGVVPGLLYLAHLTFGANQPVAALWFTALLALALCIGLIMPQGRIGLFDLKPVIAPAVLFAAVIGAALWSLTPWTPGGAHPIWAWAGVTPGSTTINPSATVLEIVKLVGLACVFVVGCLQGARRDRAASTVDAVLILGAGYAAIALLMFLTRTQIMSGGRLSGGFLSANSAATVFGMLTVLGLAALLRRWRQSTGLGLADQMSRVATPLACLLLYAACLLLTASRMGVVATVIPAALLLLWETVDGRGGQRRPVLIGGLVLLAVGGVLMLGGNTLLWERLDRIDADALTRTTIFAAHWNAFLDSPLFGYGLGSFADLNSQIMTRENYGDLWLIRAAHNVYLQWLEEAGLIGAVPMFALVGLLLGVAVWRSGQLRSGKTVMRGLIAASLVVLIHGTTDFGLQVPSIAAFWTFLLGIQYAYGQSRT